MNNLIKLTSLRTYIGFTITLFLFFLGNLNLQAQEAFTSEGKNYTLGDITVSGNTHFSPQTIVTYSGLRKGQEILIPGDKISDAIKKLWKSNLFSDINIYLVKTEGDVAYLEIRLFDLPELNELKINGIKKGKKDDLIKENNLQSGVKVTENLLTTTKNYLTHKYQKDGYLNTKVYINTIELKDSTNRPQVNMVINIDKGKKVKVRDIEFIGDSVFKESKLRKAMKNTKQKSVTHIFKRSKYIEADYKEDLVSLVDKYKENGYRDARVISDTIIHNNNKDITLQIKIEEGAQYRFGNIDFIGNTVYSDQTLKNVLRINKGDIYTDLARSRTFRYLNDLQMFRQRIEYVENVDTTLTANIYLEPKKKYALSVDLDVSQSNIQTVGFSFTPGLKIRNVFRGAETLEISGIAAIGASEDRGDNDETFFDINEFGGNIRLNIPRLFTPFNTDSIIPKYMSPNTAINLSATSQQNIGLDKQTIAGLLSYNWYLWYAS